MTGNKQDASSQPAPSYLSKPSQGCSILLPCPAPCAQKYAAATCCSLSLLQLNRAPQDVQSLELVTYWTNTSCRASRKQSNWRWKSHYLFANAILDASRAMVVRNGLCTAWAWQRLRPTSIFGDLVHVKLLPWAVSPQLRLFDASSTSDRRKSHAQDSLSPRRVPLPHCVPEDL